MTTRVMHCLAVKLCAVFRWTFAPRRRRPAVTLAKVETMIDVSVEMIRPVIPGSRTNEYAP
jgi:hypothetical protein